MCELSNMLIRPIWYPAADKKHESVKIYRVKNLSSQIEAEKKKQANKNHALKSKSRKGAISYELVADILSDQQDRLKRDLQYIQGALSHGTENQTDGH